MGRPRIITDEEKLFISKLKKENPDLTCKEIVKKVRQYKIEKYPNPNGTWTREDIEALVDKEQMAEASIQKYLTELNKWLKKVYEIDKPWCMASIDSYPALQIEQPSPNTIQVLLYAWSFLQEKNVKFTIREAKWVSRLSSILLEDIHSAKTKDIEQLVRKALEYADWEQVYNASGLVFDSTNLDKTLIKPVSSEKPFFYPEKHFWEKRQFENDEEIT